MKNVQISSKQFVLQVRPSHLGEGFSLYWGVKETNMGVPVANAACKPRYDSQVQAYAAPFAWGYPYRVEIIGAPLDTILHAVDEIQTPKIKIGGVTIQYR